MKKISNLTPYTQAQFTLISGPVWSGKTEIIEANLNSASGSEFNKNGNLIVVKHPLDDLNSPDKIGDHEVRVSDNAEDIATLITDHTRTVMIAGISHYDKAMINLVDSLVRSNRNVIASGINLGVDGRPYGIMADLMSLTDEVELAKAICNQNFCRNEHANRSVDVGDNKYEPRCTYHSIYPSGMKPLHGSLELIVGPMFSSKTDSLSKIINKAKLKQVPFVVFKWDQDDRAGDSYIKTHNGKKIEAIPVADANGIMNYLKENQNIELVVIDEGQFISGIFDLTSKLLPNQYNVVVSGLARGYNRQAFNEMPDLMCLADNIKMKKGLCTSCHHPSSESQRMKKVTSTGGKIPAHYNDDLVVVGDGNERDSISYEARCLKHWKLPGEPPLKYNFKKIE